MPQEDIPEASEGARSSLFGLTALAVLLGMQCFRMFVPLLGFLLRDRFGWSPGYLGLLALGVFLLGIAAPWVLRPLGLRRCLWLTLGTLAAARLALQMWTGDPVVDLVLVSVGLAAFAAATLCLLLMARAYDDRVGASDTFALGWLLGLLIDVVLHAAYSSWDLAWREGAWHGLVASALALAIVLFLASIPASIGRGMRNDFDAPDTGGVLAWAGIWPLMFLYVAYFGLTARVAAVATAAGGGHGLVLLQTAMLALAAGGWWRKLPQPGRLGVVSFAAFFLVLISMKLADPEPGDGVLLGFGLLFLGILLSFLVRRAALGSAGRPRWLAASHGLGTLFFLALTFGTTSAWQVKMPIPAVALPLVAAITAAVLALAAGVSRGPRPVGGRIVQYSAFVFCLAIASMIPLLPTHFPGVDDPSEVVESKDWPLRVVTYNVHCGIDPSGRLDLESLAQTLEAESPDVVILQEVSRGWLLNGGVDLPEYLSHRLGMPYLFHGTADATWGNAVLTRLPVVNVERHPLPPKSLLLRRGYLDVELQVGDEDRLRILATHLHHPRNGGEERLVQSRAMVEAWDGASRTLMAGDLNALPGEPEIELLRGAGLRDALDLAGEGSGFTFPSWDPVRRIDYVWLSPDLGASEAWVSPSTASDHAAVIAVIEPLAELQNETP